MQSATKAAIANVLLQIFITGSGYARLKMWKRLAIFWAVYIIGLYSISLALPIATNFASYAIASLFTVGISIAIVVDVYRNTVIYKTGDLVNYAPWWIVAIYAVLFFAVYELAPSKQQLLGYETFSMPKSYMAPTIAKGETFMVNTRAYTDQPIGVGDVIVIKDGNEQKFVRRVKSVAQNGIDVSVDDTTWTGDSRNAQVSQSSVVGKTTYIWFSTEFSRIGKVIQ